MAPILFGRFFQTAFSNLECHEYPLCMSCCVLYRLCTFLVVASEPLQFVVCTLLHDHTPLMSASGASVSLVKGHGSSACVRCCHVSYFHLCGAMSLSVTFMSQDSPLIACTPT